MLVQVDIGSEEVEVKVKVVAFFSRRGVVAVRL
jgi:hypothetical protein